MISGLFPSGFSGKISYAANEGGEVQGWMSPVESTANPNGVDYYVDASLGSDSNNGTSPSTAWQSLEKVNNTQFQPGDRILFKAGELWIGQLHPKGSGTDGNPIVIDQYGAGSKPRFEGRGQVQATVLLYNQSYWELYNLEVSNLAGSNLNDANSLGDFRGIHITGDNGTQLKHFRLAGLNVHDVSGEVNWISGTIPPNPEPGINFKTGWDRSKRTGGIIFDTSVVDPANPGNQATTFDDVIIENSIVQNTSFGNIIFKQYAGSADNAVHVGWGERSSATDARFTPHTNVIIRNNYLSQYDTEYGCNSIYLTGVRGAVIEGNIVAGAGTSGIELYYTDDVVIQYNEVYDTRRKAGGADHNGIDPDKATTKALIQYNYIHDTGDGILLCQFSFGDTIVRYNVIQNTERYPVYLHSDQRATAEIYNNTIYNTKSKYMIYGYGSFVNATYNLYNNVFYSNRADAVFTTGGNISYMNNSYYGADFPIPVEDTKAITLNPKIANLGNGGKGSLETGPNLSSLIAYSPLSGSPIIGAGIAVAANGGIDILGRALYNGTPDIGAIEYYGDLASTTEAITGRVTDVYNNAVANVTIELIADGQSYEATTNRTGYFELLNIPVGVSYSLVASKTGYHSNAIEEVVVTAGNTLSNIVVELEPSTVFGGVSGTVRDGLGSPLADVEIILSDDEDRSYSVTSNSDGHYTIENVMTGQGYMLTATKSGYREASLEDIAVDPGNITQVADVFLTGSHPIYLIQQDFEQVPLSSVPSDWTVSHSGGRISVVNDPSKSENQVLEIVRSSNSGSTSFSKSFAANELTGIVTIEANIMRDDNTTGNTWSSVPYIYGVGNTSPSISFAFDKGKIKAYNAGATVEIMNYELGRWYNVQLVINLITQKFDLYIDGNQVFEQAAFRTPMSQIGKIEYYANSTNYIEAYVDDIRIIRGTPYEKDNTKLENLSIDKGTLYKLSDTFYTVELANYEKTIDLIAVAESQLAQSITVNGTVVNGYEAIQTIELEEGENNIQIVVTAEDGTEKSYTLIATVVEAVKDTSLNDIQLSVGELASAFNPKVLEYEVINIEQAATTISIMPIANTATSTIEINGIEVTSGQYSTAIPITNEMSIIIKVISQDGTAYREYMLTVKRPNTSQEDTASLTGPEEAYVGRELDVTVGLSNLNGSFTLLEVVVNYDPEKFGIATVEHEGKLSLADSAITTINSSLQVLGTAVKPAQGQVYIILASLGEPVTEAGELFTLHGHIVEEAAAGALHVSLSDFEVSFEAESTQIDVSDAQLSIEVKLADKATLIERITSAQGLYNSTTEGNSPGQYPSGARAAFYGAIQAALAVSDNEEATQAEVDAAISALQSALGAYQGAVIPSETTDTAALQSAILSAQAKLSRAVAGDRLGQYPQAAIDALSAAISTAQGVYNNGAASQGQVNDATVALNQAVQSFTATMITFVEGSGKITIKDLSLLVQYYGVTNQDAEWSEIEIADVVGAGRIDIVVLAAIAQMILDEWLVS